MYTRALTAIAMVLSCVCFASALHAHGARAPYDLRSIALAQRLALKATPEASTAANVSAPDVVELRFAEFFRAPAGALGLEFTDRLRALDGKRVRIVGYVVGQDKPSPGRFILAPFRVQLSTVADGPADDLPPAHVHVALPASYANSDLPPIPVPIVVQGTLHLGAQPEADERVSWVRIDFDPDDPRLRTATSASAT